MSFRDGVDGVTTVCWAMVLGAIFFMALVMVLLLGGGVVFLLFKFVSFLGWMVIGLLHAILQT